MGTINATHRDRKAVVYVRQSTMAQVMNNTESTLRQRELKKRAASLGWPDNAIEIIDDDLGKSGKDSAGRGGFTRLARAVAQHEVGAIFALEISRLARSSHDWQRLLALCAVAEVVVVDEQTVYDPKHHDDKLLLDLKGTMSEAELHWLSLRMAGARRSKARRGEMALSPPTGYLWQDGNYVFDPDRSVQQAIRTLFERFNVEPSAGAVVRWAKQNGFLVPTRNPRGGGSHETAWRLLSCTRLVSMLHNPVYAGIYAYGRGQEKTVLHEGKIKKRSVQSLDCTQWPVKLQNHHPAYITWSQFCANQAKLAANRRLPANVKQGAPRQGRAMLTGLVICGSCGRPVRPVYAGGTDYFTYSCRGDLSYGGGRCFSVPGKPVDCAVEDLFLRTMVPEEISLTLAVATEAEAQAKELKEAWALRLEQCRYQAQLAERRYKAVDPDHRVVARSLEAQWNEALEVLSALESDYRLAQQTHKVILTEADRARIRALAKDLPAVWRAKSTRQDERKAMLRLAIEAITLRPIDLPKRETLVFVRWHSGATTELRVPRPSRIEPNKTPDDVINRIRLLMDNGLNDSDIADTLNIEGYLTGQQMAFDLPAVRWVRRRYQLRRPKEKVGAHPLPPQRSDGRYSIKGLADHLGTTPHVIHRWIRQQAVIAHKEPYERFAATWWIQLDPDTETRLRADINKHLHLRR